MKKVIVVALMLVVTGAGAVERNISFIKKANSVYKVVEFYASITELEQMIVNLEAEKLLMIESYDKRINNLKEEVKQAKEVE